MVLSKRDGLVTAFVVLGLNFWTCLVNQFLREHLVRNYKNNQKIYRKNKKTRFAPPIPIKVLPGRPRELLGDLGCFGAGGSWSIWSTPGRTPKSPKLANIAKNEVCKFHDFSECILEASPDSFGVQSDLQSMKIGEKTPWTKQIGIF